MKHQITDEELELIFRYLDNDLSEHEEAVFIEQLQSNLALQQAFDQQVLMSRYLSKEMPEPIAGDIPEAADVFITKVTNTFKGESMAQATVIPIAKKKYSMRVTAAAAIVVLVLSGLVYYIIRDRSEDNNLAHRSDRDSAPIVKQVTPQPDSNRFLASVDMEETYKDYYKILANDVLKVPAAATPYQFLYEKHNYKEMAAKTEDALNVKGRNAAGDKTKNYFNFYKALSNLEIGKTDIAESLLREVVIQSSRIDLKFHQVANWYLLMVYLKKGNKQNAVLMAEMIANDKGNLYYKNKAIAIKAVLQK